ncbi:hypothetical protein FC56_GL001380 [Lentilactobacillus senioris DSM 24302 = JCM 17472]|uniref:Uncharacterized protein n=1 Tax=Lentilactobacillus senioris DSM 24302 = JCM 17472 TaxID=1423802 RepID=A0A0R2D1P3_9LACO|nr:hypothetical protein FC56_GL001380 [Lentilactobacillus senioris DSM 24302 = JCM 17472]
MDCGHYRPVTSCIPGNKKRTTRSYTDLIEVQEEKPFIEQYGDYYQKPNGGN